MHILSAENLSKSYGDKVLFENLTFHMNQGDKMGLIAPNGTGKSTLLKMVCGIIPSDALGSKIFIHPSVRVGFLQQAEDVNPEDSIMDYIFSSPLPQIQALKKYKQAVINQDDNLLTEANQLMDQSQGWNIEARIEEILSKLNVPAFDAVLGSLSGGQMKRVSLTKLLIDDPDLLILDEPTNHLDVEMIKWLENYLSMANKSIFMVTHDRYFLEDVCNQIIEIYDGQLFTYAGSYSQYLEKKEERRAWEVEQKDKASKVMKKELEWLRRMPKARTTKNKARVDSFDDIKKAAQKSIYSHELTFNIEPRRLGSKILEFENVSKSYGSHEVIKSFSYKWQKGEKIGLVGKNGAGKSTLLNLITQNIEPDSGQIVHGTTIHFGYFNQQGMQVENDQPIIDIIKSVADHIPTKGGGTMTAEQLMERFMFPRSQQRVYYSLLSGGEKRRLYLLKILMTNPNFLILDEPTNDLDILTLNTLEEFLMEFEGCVIIASHDRYLTDKIADHLLILDGQGGIKDFNGSYGAYLEWQREFDAEKQKSKQDKSPSTKPKENDYELRKKVKSLENQIDKLEKEKVKLENKFNDPNLSLEEIQKWNTALGEIKEQIVIKEEEWEALVENL
ncbi:ABC-F family ATP-binding cassette domain-containing protein [Membranihabitans marinus]|uniref:ABC-F family ATP-binding cassette domain-containing protein n=1 Tax=Membranihabitans marinus TaxID=1227546 RepID=UPI001F1C5D9C|nr:ABC-F family ATP-binding cassette domain-containing protein [Membranihabitans marinus]